MSDARPSRRSGAATGGCRAAICREPRWPLSAECTRQGEPGRGGDHPVPGADPRHRGPGARLLLPRCGEPLPLGADPPQVADTPPKREGLPPLQQVRPPTLFSQCGDLPPLQQVRLPTRSCQRDDLAAGPLVQYRVERNYANIDSSTTPFNYKPICKEVHLRPRHTMTCLLLPCPPNVTDVTVIVT